MSSYFTLVSANAALPEVIKRYKFVLQCKMEVVKAEEQMQVAVSNDARLEEHVRIKQDLNSKVIKYYRSIEHLELTGVAIKSIDDGLLDFPARRFDEDIWLCWKDGETQVKFWHEKHIGFMGRKPVEVSNESLV